MGITKDASTGENCGRRCGIIVLKIFVRDAVNSELRAMGKLPVA